MKTELVADPPAEIAEAQRRCLASGRVDAATALIRLVVDPEGEVVPDVAAVLPGRGMWLSPSPALIEKACKRNLFAKAAGCSVRVPADLAERIRDQLWMRCLATVGLACRAGQAVFGFDRCRSRLRSGKAGAVLAAADGSLAERERLLGARGDIPCIDLFDSVTLGTAVGRPAVVHGVIDAGRLCERLLSDAGRLAGLLGKPFGAPAVTPSPVQ